MAYTASSRRSPGFIAFFDNILQRLVLQAQIGVHLLQPPVLFLELFQSLQSTGIHSAVLGFSLVEGALTETMFPAQFFQRDARFGFFQDIDDLCLAECRTLHVVSPGSILPEVSTFRWYYFTGGLPNLDADFLQQLRFAHKNRLKGLGR
jgi:hypothetical protein